MARGGAAFSVARVGLGDIDLPMHLVTLTFSLRGMHGTWSCSRLLLRGRHGTYGTGLGLVGRLVAPGRAAFCVAGGTW